MKINVPILRKTYCTRTIDVPESCTREELITVAKQALNTSPEAVHFYSGAEIDEKRLAQNLQKKQKEILKIDFDTLGEYVEKIKKEQHYFINEWQPKAFNLGDHVLVRLSSGLTEGKIVAVRNTAEDNPSMKDFWQTVIVELQNPDGKTVRGRFASREVFRNLEEYITLLKEENYLKMYSDICYAYADALPKAD